jgi:hypothetical protein
VRQFFVAHLELPAFDAMFVAVPNPGPSGRIDPAMSVGIEGQLVSRAM